MEYPRNKTHTHFVIFADGDDYLRNMFADVIDDDNVEFIPSAIPYRLQLRSFWKRALYRIHFSRISNSLFKLPFKELWYRHFYEGKDTGNLCFVFFMDVLLPQYIPLFEGLKKRYPSCKMVVYLIDLLASRKGALDTSLIDRYMDLGISFDKKEAATFSLLYYPNFISKLEIADDPSIPESDFCFIGAAKDREGRINDVYTALSEQGFKCDFIIYENAKEGLLSLADGITIIPKALTYKDYLKHIGKCKCIVEIQQSATNSHTLRVWEALLYGKKLLSDNEELPSLSFYDSKQFALFRKDYDKAAMDEFLLNNPPKPKESSECEASAKGFLSFLATRLELD